MENLELQVRQTAGVIECNFKELKEALAVQMSAYEDLVVDEDSIPQYKKELATLRKIRGAVDDRRKEIKRDFLEPLDAFEDEVKSLLEEIDKPIDNINAQLKLFEEDRILHKRERIAKLYVEQVGEYLEFLPIEENYNPKWDNKSYTNESIKYDISEKLVKVKSDLGVIKSLNSEIESDIIEAYKKSGNDLSKAIERNQQYLNDKARISANVESKTESAEKPNPLEGSKLNEFVQMTKTVRIILSKDDLDQVKETLDFMGIKYQVEGE